ncbi:hypothetical protein AAE478_005418 [Parahypoxylon ruwenzoriense]
MAISWGTIKSLLIFFGPILLPKALSYYRSLRASSRGPGQSVRPLPSPSFRALALLVSTAAVLLVLALPVFAPENLFARTQSRLQIPTDVLFNRLAALRPGNALTATDSALRLKFVNLESRLLYLRFGPRVLADCPFCASDDPRSYLYYAAPSLLAPHLLNLVLVSAATSDLIAGSDPSHGSTWRGFGALSAGLLSALDLYLAGSYNHQANSRATRLSELTPFFWQLRAFRYASLGALDLILAGLIYLSSTRRLFAAAPSTAARVEATTRALQTTKSRLNAVAIVKNAAARDEELRARGAAYWQHEGRLMREVMEERDVVEGVNDALQNRINIRDIMRDADAYALNVLPEGVPETTTVG